MTASCHRDRGSLSFSSISRIIFATVVLCALCHSLCVVLNETEMFSIKFFYDLCREFILKNCLEL